MKKILPLIAVASILLAGYFFFKPSHHIKNTSLNGSSIICFGDSLTYGTGSTPGKNYPAQLSLLISKPVINAGIPGDTTTTAFNRLERDVLARSSRIVIVTLGGNDLKNRVFRETVFNNLKNIIESI